MRQGPAELRPLRSFPLGQAGPRARPGHSLSGSAARITAEKDRDRKRRAGGAAEIIHLAVLAQGPGADARRADPGASTKVIERSVLLVPIFAVLVRLSLAEVKVSWQLTRTIHNPTSSHEQKKLV